MIWKAVICCGLSALAGAMFGAVAMLVILQIASRRARK